MRVFGRDADMLERFDERNEELYKACFGAQFVSGMIFPAMKFVSYLSYVGIAVVGGLRVASGSMSLGDATAFIQYSREFTQPLGQMAGMANMLQSGVASAERVFEFLDADEQDAETATRAPARQDRRPRGVPSTSPSATPRTSRSSRTFPSPPNPGTPWRSSAPPVPARPRW